MFLRILIIITVGVGFFLTPLDAQAARNEDLKRAKAAAGQGDWESVAEYAQKAVEKNPKDADSWALLGRAVVFLGDTAAAIDSYERAVERNPRHPQGVLELTSLYVTRGQLAEAERVVSAAEMKDSRGKIDEIKVARGLLLGAEGKIGEATPILMNATGKHPDNPLYPMMLARIYNNAGVMELAATNYEKAWNLDEGDPELAFEYGQVLLRLRRYDEANRLFSIVQERDPDNKHVDYLRGRLFHAAGRYAEATTELEKAVDKRPEDFLSNYWLGRSYLDLAISSGVNTFGLAVAPLSKALELRPERDDVSDELAKAVFEQGKFNYLLANQDTTDEYKTGKLQQANDLFHESLEYDPIQNEIYSYMARTHDRLGNLDSSLYYTDRQLEMTLLRVAGILDSLDIRQILDTTRMGEVHVRIPEIIVPDFRVLLDSVELVIKSARMSMSDVTRKISILQRLGDQQGLIVFLDPLMGDDDIFNRYGMILANAFIETRDYPKAREMINRLIEKDPTDCDLHQLNAYIDLKRERYFSAISVLLEGVKACPKSPDLWIFLGDSYYFSNEKDKATVKKSRDAYKRACDLGGATGCEKYEQIEQILAAWRQ